MDEASQVDIAAGALALSCADKAVIVGDLKQLPNVVDAQTEEVVSAIFSKYGISESYRYSTNSFLSSICSLYPKIPQTLLREHYRCNPLIIGFCSKQFYDGELIPMKKDDSSYAPIRVVRTVQGNHARGAVNIRQVDTIVQEILPSIEENFTLVVSAEGQPDSNLQDLIDYIEYNQGETKQSCISSIFDLLYEDYTKHKANAGSGEKEKIEQAISHTRQNSSPPHSILRKSST